MAAASTPWPNSPLSWAPSSLVYMKKEAAGANKFSSQAFYQPAFLGEFIEHSLALMLKDNVVMSSRRKNNHFSTAMSHAG